MKKHHISLKAKYKYVVISYYGNHFLKRLHLVAKLMDLNTTISLWLRVKKWKRATVALGKSWYQFGMNFLEKHSSLETSILCLRVY